MRPPYCVLSRARWRVGSLGEARQAQGTQVDKDLHDLLEVEVRLPSAVRLYVNSKEETRTNARDVIVKRTGRALVQ